MGTESWRREMQLTFSLGIFTLLSALGVGLAAFAWVTDYRLVREDDRPESFRWLRRWTIQGLLAPSLIWSLMNFGLSLELQAFMPRLQAAQSSKLWFPLYAAYVAAGFTIISSYWTGLTLGWIAWRSGRELKGDARADFRALCWTSLAAMSLPALGFIWVGGWLALGLAAITLLAPVAGYAPAILRPKKMPPMYARAIARMKFGKYADAETEVIRQLEGHEDDFEGWLMLAELYAIHFQDLPEAEQTILEICDQPRTTPGQVGIALHRLADWHLKLSEDPDAARRALAVISNRMPGTHLARMAELRASSLPHTAEELREQKVNKPVYLPALVDPLDDEKSGPAATPDAKEAADRAAQLRDRVKNHPADLAPREELARLLAGPLNQPAAAISQVEGLIALPDQPPDKIANWLGLIASWQLSRLHDRDAARETLRRLIREHPNTPTAFSAQRRLVRIDQEEKLAALRPAVTPRIRIEVSGTSQISERPRVDVPGAETEASPSPLPKGREPG